MPGGGEEVYKFLINLLVKFQESPEQECARDQEQHRGSLSAPKPNGWQLPHLLPPLLAAPHPYPNPSRSSSLLPTPDIGARCCFARGAGLPLLLRALAGACSHPPRHLPAVSTHHRGPLRALLALSLTLGQGTESKRVGRVFSSWLFGCGSVPESPSPLLHALCHVTLDSFVPCTLTWHLLPTCPEAGRGMGCVLAKGTSAKVTGTW